VDRRVLVAREERRPRENGFSSTLLRYAGIIVAGELRRCWVAGCGGTTRCWICCELSQRLRRINSRTAPVE